MGAMDAKAFPLDTDIPKMLIARLDDADLAEYGRRLKRGRRKFAAFGFNGTMVRITRRQAIDVATAEAQRRAA